MGTSKGYGGSTAGYSYGGSSSGLGSSYGSSSRGYPRYSNKTYGSVRDKVKQFSMTDRYPSLERSNSLIDRYSNSDPYGRSGYMSDYGGSTRSYNSWDRASNNRSGRSYGGVSVPQKRESSPYSSRSSRYDYSSSASPYSSLSSYRSSSDVSPSSRKFERQTSRPTDYSIDYNRRISVDKSRIADKPKAMDFGIDYTRKRAAEPSRPLNAASKREPKREGKPRVDYSSTDSQGSAAETGTCKHPAEAEESKAALTKQKRNRTQSKDSRAREAGGRKPRNEQDSCETKPPAEQQQQQQPGSRRSRQAGGSRDPTSGSGGGLSKPSGPGEMFSKYRERFMTALGPNPVGQVDEESSHRRKSGYRNSTADGTISDAPSEKSWRKAVYGESSATPSRASRRKPAVEETESDMTSALEDEDGRGSRYDRRRWQPRTSTPNSSRLKDPDTDYSEHTSAVKDQKPSSRRDRCSQGSSRDSRHGFSRSSSRDSILDDKPRRRRHGSKELLEGPGEREPNGGGPTEKAPLTPETLSLRDSIEKVNKWKQNLPATSKYYNEQQAPKESHRHPGVGAEKGYSRNEEQYPYGSTRSPRHSERDVSPDRHRQQSRSTNGSSWKQSAYARQDSRSVREESPTGFSRDSSPNRRKYRSRKHPSRGNSNDSVFAPSENDLDRNSNLPNKDFRKSELNKDFRKSELNKAKRLQFERDQSPNDRRPGHYRYKRTDSQTSRTPKSKYSKGSGSSSDAFSRDESPNSRNRRGISRQHSTESRRIKRDSSREDLLDDRHYSQSNKQTPSYGSRKQSVEEQNRYNRKGSRTSRKETWDRDNEQASESGGFSREGSPNRYGNRGKPPLPGRTSRQSSVEDILDDRSHRKADKRYPPSRQSSQEQRSDKRKVPGAVNSDKGMLMRSTSQHSQNGGLPDIIPHGTGKDVVLQPIDQITSQQKASDNRHILDQPVPKTSHHPLQPSPAKDSQDTGASQKTRDRPRSSAFDVFNKKVAEETHHHHQQQQLQHERKHEPKKITPKQESSRGGLTPEQTAVGKMKYVPLRAEITPTSERMWAKLQNRKGEVTIRDILDLCEKARKPKVIIVPGWDDDAKFQGYQTLDEMLDVMGIEVAKVSKEHGVFF